MKIKKDLKIISLIFIISRLLFIFFLISKHDLSFFKLYDVNGYLEIAESGYIHNTLYAFFPLFPLLIKLLTYIIPSYEASALILSNLFSYLSILVLYKLIENNKYKYYIITLFIFSPILVFNTIGYTESLYLLLTLYSYYLYKNNKYFLCGIFIGLSMITRNTGIVFLGAIGLDMLYKLYKKEISIKDLVILTIPAILIGFSYSVYLYIEKKDFFYYITVQYTEWYKNKTNLIALLIKDIQHFINHFDLIIPYVFLQNWLFFFIGLFYGIKNMKKETALSIYIVVSLLLFTTTYRNSTIITTMPSISFFRYELSLFPIYLLPFINMKNKSKILNIIIYISITIAIINSLLFYSEVYIA